MIHGIVVLVIGAVGVVNAGLFWFLPILSRRDLYFAVTVAPTFRDDPDGKAILRRYRAELLLVSGVTLVVAAAGDAWLGMGFAPCGYFLQIAAAFVAFYRARRRVLPHAVAPTTIREADLHGPRRIVPGGRIAASGPFVFLVACSGYLWGAPGAGVYFLATASLLSAFGLMLYGMGHWVRPIHAGGAEGARELKFRRTVAGIILAAQYFIVVQASWIELARRSHALKAGKSGPMIIGLLPLVPVLVLVALVALARRGQGGGRWPSASSTVPVGDHTQDKYWKLGVFYCNRDDQAVLIERRFGLGYTLNFARPATWIILCLLLMGALVPVLASRLRVAG